MILASTIERNLLLRSAYLRRKMSMPRWIHELSAETDAADPQSWPPRNEAFAYDWNLPTNQVYRDDNDVDEKAHFTPAFATARSRLDYSYHSNLVLRRQLLQDSILAKVAAASEGSRDEKDQLCTVDSKQRPWIVFTAGPMGVGKGYVLTQLQQTGVFPIKNFVKIDPDMIKSELPEMAGYLRTDKESAATKLHRESTQIADVLFEFALSNQLPILVDGSLRNVDYYKELFERIHRDTPYRIAILHVTADRDVIIDRAKRRAEKSGRVVPHDLLEESMKQVPRSVSILSKLADATHVIANNENKPLELVSSRVRSSGDRLDEISSPTWKEFARLWNKEDNDTVTTPERCQIAMPICHMATVFDCAESHAAANNIWAQAYPNFCARCALACDGQCGICIHGRHLCACPLCNDSKAKQIRRVT